MYGVLCVLFVKVCCFRLVVLSVIVKGLKVLFFLVGYFVNIL